MSDSDASTGGGFGVDHEHAVALYDRETGAVTHIQRVTVFHGGRDVTAEQAVERAFEHARHAGHDVERLEALALPDDFDYGSPHRVDIARGTLERSEPASRRP